MNLQPGLPKDLLLSLEGIAGYDAGAFARVHVEGGQVTSIRYNPMKGGAPAGLERVPWSSDGYYLPQRPSFTFDPLLHAGVYYVQEASSMFLEQALRQTVDLARPLRVLDLCAAPGGKSTLIQSLISAESLLVSNEVIRTRVNILQENITKWGAANVVVTSNDPRDMQRLPGYFDLIVVDAPCSGSGLFRRDPDAVREWSLGNVEVCHQRQQRILADVWPALKPDGILIYSTCSYSQEEDEDILDWMQDELGGESCRLAVDAAWGIVETTGKRGGWGYRMWPDKVAGEGLYLSVVKKRGDVLNGEGGGDAEPGADGGGRGRAAKSAKVKKSVLERVGNKEVKLLEGWVTGEMRYVRREEDIIALPPFVLEELEHLTASLYIKKAGVLMGKLAGGSLIPDHELAVSVIVHDDLPAIDLSREQAIQYLRKDELPIETDVRGWALVRFEGKRLGWVKVLPNRLNNYYPKEWRILKRAV